MTTTSTTSTTGLITLRRAAGEDCEIVCDVLPGALPPVVVLTGATGTRQISAMMMQDLVGKRQLVMPDPRGHGESICRHPEHYSLRQLIDDVYFWLDELDITQCNLVGTSLGAIVATGIAVERPELLVSLALTSPAIVARDVAPSETQQTAIDRLVAAFGTKGAPDAERTASEFSALSGMPIQQARQRLALHRDLQSVAIYFRAVRHEDIPFNLSDLKRITVPTLVLPGADVVHPAEVGIQLASAIPSASITDLAEATSGVNDPIEFRLIVFAEVARWLLAQV